MRSAKLKLNRTSTCIMPVPFIIPQLEEWYYSKNIEKKPYPVAQTKRANESSNLMFNILFLFCHHSSSLRSGITLRILKKPSPVAQTRRANESSNLMLTYCFCFVITPQARGVVQPKNDPKPFPVPTYKSEKY